MRTLILAFIGLILGSTVLQAATHSGSYHPATDATLSMLTPSMGYAVETAADTVALEKAAGNLKKRTQAAWIAGGFDFAFILVAILGTLPSLVPFLFIIAILTLFFSISLITALLSLGRVRALLLDASPAVQRQFMLRTLGSRLALKVLLYLATVGIAGILLLQL